MRFAAFALLLCIGASGVARAAEPEPYLFDVLALQPYKGNFARLVKAKDIPDWVKAASSQGEGTAVPMKTVDIGGTPYRLDHICKVHDCAGNTLDVLWAPRGAKVWAALVDSGKPAVMLGDPKAPQAKALTEAASASAVPVTPAPTPPVVVAPAIPAPPAPATPAPPATAPK